MNERKKEWNQFISKMNINSMERITGSKPLRRTSNLKMLEERNGKLYVKKKEVTHEFK